MLHIAICDDMPEESAVLKNMLMDYAETTNQLFSIDIFTSGFLFLEEITQKRQFELCFLDIYMPSFSGLETAKELRTIDKEMALIFCTSATQFALDGYGVQANNYLVKPVKKEELFTAMDEVLRKIQVEKGNVLWFQTATGLQRVNHNQISYCEPEVNFSRLILRDGTSLSSRFTFSELCENLTQFPYFTLLSRSILMNFEAVTGMEGGTFLLVNQGKLPIPRRKKKEITKAFLDYSMGK